MNENKIDFIICYNNDMYMQECMKYIHRLHVPKGITTEILAIKGAESTNAAYNAALQKSDAKYKVYIHQDLFIVNQNFIQDVIDIFEEHKEYGMLGLTGTNRFVENANYWSEWDTGAIYANNGIRQMTMVMENSKELTPVIAVDGMCIITQYDIPWREDKFDGFDFYDVSQCMEFMKAGYQIGIPYQEKPWCIHDCGPSKVVKYDDYRAVFCEEYELYGYRYQSDEFNVKMKKLNEVTQKVLEMIHVCWKKSEFKTILEIMQDAEHIIGGNGELCALRVICKIREISVNQGIPDYLKIEESSFEELRERINRCKFFLMRLEENFSLEELQDELGYISQREGKELGDYYIVAQNACRNPNAVMQKLCSLLESLYGKKASFCSCEDM